MIMAMLSRVDENCFKPQGIFLAPNEELVDQISLQILTLSLDAVEAMKLTCFDKSKRKQSDFYNLLNDIQYSELRYFISPIELIYTSHIIITTPKVLVDLATAEPVYMKNIKLVAFDEADMMLEIFHEVNRYVQLKILK